MRSPRRITTTLPNHVFNDLVQRSLLEGRSLSNLAAYLLECALRPQHQTDAGRRGPAAGS